MTRRDREGDGGEQQVEEGRDVRIQRAEGGSLYVVATPLGNLRDLTLRARDVLSSVDVIAAEDTRVTATLLTRYGIATRTTPVHEHNEARRANEIASMLASGRSVALVTDAGTPGISDPGARIVRAARDAGHRVVPVPGPSAAAAAVSAAGLVAERFVFVGFLPSASNARRTLLRELSAVPAALVIYEAPHRVRATVQALAEAMPGRDLVVGRELTKAFETISRLRLEDAVQWFAADPNRERGEFVLVVDVAEEPSPRELDAEVERWLAALLSELSPSRAAKVAAAATGISRDALYERARQLKGEPGSC